MKENSNFLHLRLLFRIVIPNVIIVMFLLPGIVVAEERTYPVYKPYKSRNNDGGQVQGLFSVLSNWNKEEIYTDVSIENNKDEFNSMNSSTNPFKHSLNGDSIIYNSVQSLGNIDYPVISRPAKFSNNRGYISIFSINAQHSSLDNIGKIPFFSGTLGSTGYGGVSNVINSIFDSNNSKTDFFQTSEQNLTFINPMQKSSPLDPTDPSVIPVGNGTTLLLLMVGIYGLIKLEILKKMWGLIYKAFNLFKFWRFIFSTN